MSQPQTGIKTRAEFGQSIRVFEALPHSVLLPVLNLAAELHSPQPKPQL